MKENKYDDPQFFHKYGQMDRSQSGLDGAGEWHELKKLRPDFAGKAVLDLGCGYGWHCKYAAGHGAAYVLGTDISQRMLETAREKNAGPSIEYRCAAMEDLDFPTGSFDVVLSSLAFHYVRDFKPLLQNGFRLLRVVEPQPPEHMMELPGMKEELRRPMMLLVSAERVGA